MKLLVLHPGDMGASIGACAVAAGHEVLWHDAGRSAATRERARRANLSAVEDLASALVEVEGVVSVCPPAAAAEVAATVVAAGYAGCYVEANAIAPATSRQIAERHPSLNFVDGGIVGPPAWGPDRTRLFLSGADADAVAGWFAGSDLTCVPLGEAVGQASAIKMCYAAWTKGSSALLLGVRALARHHGVADALVSEWDRSQPGTEQRAERTAAGSAPKAWRWVGEMEEIAATFDAAGLPAGFHEGAAALFAAMAEFKDAEDAVGLDKVVQALLREAPEE